MFDDLGVRGLAYVCVAGLAYVCDAEGECSCASLYGDLLRLAEAVYVCWLMADKVEAALSGLKTHGTGLGASICSLACKVFC